MLTFYCGTGGKSKYDAIAIEEGWELGVRSCGRYNPVPSLTNFVDNDWENYNHYRHLEMVKRVKPKLATARDICCIDDFDEILTEAEQIARFCQFGVILIPKVAVRIPDLDFNYILGFSVPTRYGRCDLPLSYFGDSPVHLLGGSPYRQLEYSRLLNVVSLDCNTFMLLAKYGKSTWPDASPREQKLASSCYGAFRVSVQRTKQYWSHYDDAARTLPTIL